MVGIYSKIKNGLNNFKNKVIAPVFGTIADLTENPYVNSLINWAAPAVDSLIPGLGTGISTALPYANKISRKISEWATPEKQPSRTKQVDKGIHLARDIDDLHGRLELKPEITGTEIVPYTRSYVEEVE